MFEIEQWSSRETVVELPLPATGDVYYIAFVGTDREDRITAALPAMHRAVTGTPTEINSALELADEVWTVPMSEVIADIIRDEMIMRGIEVEGATK